MLMVVLCLLGMGLFASEARAAGGDHIQPVGASGIIVRFDGATPPEVQEVRPGAPAAGKIIKGDLIVGVNGVLLEEKTRSNVLGRALTKAEATDGKLVFDVKPGKKGKVKQVTIRIPVLGAYSKTWPVNCGKSKAIIEKAAAFYGAKGRLTKHDMASALTCLFLLSTGDDRYVPRVKEYFARFLDDPKKVGEQSWYNGWNGVAVAEYYLRTGDKSVLPLLQHYCNDARDRQVYGVGWGHWGEPGSPGYEAGGGMQHSAGNQMLLTLVLGKVCGVNVDDKALVGALRHWYRFVGRGAIPVSDTRYWATLRSAGRDGMTACVMQVASLAEGDVSIYKRATEYLGMSAITTCGTTHSTSSTYFNDGWQGMGRSLSGSFQLDYNADVYHMGNRGAEFYLDLDRDAAGATWWYMSKGGMDPQNLGAFKALVYTAPLKTLCITGAPRSKHAKAFRLPENLWGNEADRAFVSAKNHPDFYKYGKEDDPHITPTQLPVKLRYNPRELKDLPLDVMRKNVRHARAEFRRAAAKALIANKRYDEIEQLLCDPDPRLRRAALDGIVDCRGWFVFPIIREHALRQDAYTPAMIDAITRMLSDPDEAWFVVDGALLALHHAPVEAIKGNLPSILKWTKHEDWWLRESAFLALLGLEKDTDDTLFVKYLPTLTGMMIDEYRYNPRQQMLNQLKAVLKRKGNDSPAGKLIIAGLVRAVTESKVLPDLGRIRRAYVGRDNIEKAALALIHAAPESAANLADALVRSGQLKSFPTSAVMNIVKAQENAAGVSKVHDRFVGLLPALEKVPPQQRKRLTDILYDVLRPALIERFVQMERAGGKATEKGRRGRPALINLLVDLKRLKHPDAGWKAIGTPAPAERVWRYHTFDPLREEDKRHPGSWECWRTAAVPAGMAKWYMPGFDDSKWNRGKSPIGVGEFTAAGHGRMWVTDPGFSHKSNSDWGAGEFLLARTTFGLASRDYDYVRIRVLSFKGYTVYLNGHQIRSWPWSAHYPVYAEAMLGEGAKHLTKGVNTLAVYGIAGHGKDADGQLLSRRTDGCDHRRSAQGGPGSEGMTQSPCSNGWPKRTRREQAIRNETRIQGDTVMKTSKRIIALVAIAAIVGAIGCAQAVAAKPLKVYILVGQSNMQGHARVSTFDYIGDDPGTAPLLKLMRDADGNVTVCDRVWISYQTSGRGGAGEGFGKLTAGYGARVDPKIDGGKIGPEFTFGLTMQQAYDGPILLIKAAWGGKSLHTDFRPPSAGAYEFSEAQLAGLKKQGKDIAQAKADKAKRTGHYYRLMTGHVNKVLADIKRVYPDYDPKAGYEIAGFVWFQGWNDMVDSGTYPGKSQAARFGLYSKLLATFIRDVRKEFDAPKMPFVIGVMGVGGVKDTPDPFRQAMAAPASMPEFKGSVAAVKTAPYWDKSLAAISAKHAKMKVGYYLRKGGFPASAMAKFYPLAYELRKEYWDTLPKDRKMTKADQDAYLKEYRAKLISPAEDAMWKRGASNAGYHYYGSAKILAQIGQAFAKATLKMEKK